MTFDYFLFLLMSAFGQERPVQRFVMLHFSFIE